MPASPRKDREGSRRPPAQDPARGRKQGQAEQMGALLALALLCAVLGLAAVPSASAQTHTFLKQETCPQSLAMPDDQPARVDSGMACVAKCRAHEGAGTALFYATGEPTRPRPTCTSQVALSRRMLWRHVALLAAVPSRLQQTGCRTCVRGRYGSLAILMLSICVARLCADASVNPGLCSCRTEACAHGETAPASVAEAASPPSESMTIIVHTDSTPCISISATGSCRPAYISSIESESIAPHQLLAMFLVLGSVLH